MNNFENKKQKQKKIQQPCQSAFSAYQVNQIVVTDLANMAQDAALLQLAEDSKGNIDAAIATLGVNEPFGWTLQQLMDVEYTLTTTFAQFCHDALDVKYISLLTMAGTTRDSPFSAEELETEISYFNVFDLAPRVKGEIETAVLAVGIPYTTFIRPANFETDEYRFGALDWFAQAMCTVANLFVPSEWHSIHVNDIAKAMFADVNKATDGIAQAGETVGPKERIMQYDELMAASESTTTKEL